MNPTSSLYKLSVLGALKVMINYNYFLVTNPAVPIVCYRTFDLL